MFFDKKLKSSLKIDFFFFKYIFFKMAHLKKKINFKKIKNKKNENFFYKKIILKETSSLQETICFFIKKKKIKGKIVPSRDDLFF